MRRASIVGAGITGTCSAHELAAREGVDVAVLERDGEQPRGSTTFAPGFVGLYDDAAVLTDLARASAEVYDTIAAGFERRGGLELATTQAGAAEVERRVEAAPGGPAHAGPGPGRAARTGRSVRRRRLLQPGARLAPQERVNGVFAMTPDNLPLLGPHPEVDGVWRAQVLWVTHAAGAARALTRAMTGGAPLPCEVAVERFGLLDDTTRIELRSAALRLYRDIYAHEIA